MKKKQFLELVRSNINEYGYHVTLVLSNAEPRFAYTIGLSDSLGFELVFAGGVYYLKDDVIRIFHEIVESNQNIKSNSIEIDTLGAFTLSEIHPSWTQLMLLGVFDYYASDNVRAFQIMPDADHVTLEVPNMSNLWNTSSESIWQWLEREWDYPVPSDSTVITNIKAMRGSTITEITRWENNEWEMFAGAGPDVIEEDMRVVSLATILGIDRSVLPSINLEVGKGLWRDSGSSDWNAWG